MKNHKLFWGSSYDRGLSYLLFMWEDIRKFYPDASLEICYGWQTFDALTRNNPERQEWKKNIESLMGQPGIVHHGRLGKEELAKVRQSCGIWAYPTDFFEIFCITALEAQADGLVPASVKVGALGETVGSGFLVEGDIKEPKVRNEYLKRLLGLMGDEEKWKRESEKAKKFAKGFDWTTQAKKWLPVFQGNRKPFVSICTPTIRKGFWNVMAHNISKQTYSNLEWIVVDAFPTDRKEIMKKYCEKHGIKNWQYLREKPRKVKRKYSLVNANNTGWQNAKGELLVWLQDFVLMPETGIERMVDIYLHNPSALIAPIDVYHLPKVKPDVESEDWFNGELDVIGKFKWANIRNKYFGLYKSDNPFDFEQNYMGISRKVVELLNGWWEFIDDGLGYDNTDIATRAQQLGCQIIIDAENVAVCIDHWEALKDKEAELGKERTHNLNDARYFWMKRMLEKGKLPLIRSQELDDSISLKCDIPKSMTPDQAKDWIRANIKQLGDKWEKEIKL